MNIERKPLTAEYKVNQIGHYKELMAGAGSKIFKVNPAGVFIGAANFSSAPFRVDYNGNANITGTITATGGSITGDMTVSGSLTVGTGARKIKLNGSTGALNFIYNSNTKGSLYSDNTGSMIFTTDDNILFFDTSNHYIGKIFYESSSVYGIEIQSGGQIQWTSGRKIDDTGSSLEISGDLTPNINLGNDCGTTGKNWNNIRGRYVHASIGYRCAGSDGDDVSGYGFLTTVRHKSGSGSTAMQGRFGEVTVKGGIVTNITSPGDWVDL